MAVFRPAKAEWHDILDSWRKESRCADNLPKTIFPSLLYKLFRRLKPENLVSGFRATGIVPLERNEILKRLPGTNDTTNVQEFSFNQSVLDVLKENCGVGQKKREKRKRGKRIEPGKRVGANDFLSEDKENEKPTSSKWKARKERKVSRKVDEDENDNVWICNECKEVWDDDDENRWILCDICDAKFHLQCSGFCYEIDEYWNINLENIIFHCDGCLSDV